MNNIDEFTLIANPIKKNDFAFNFSDDDDNIMFDLEKSEKEIESLENEFNNLILNCDKNNEKSIDNEKSINHKKIINNEKSTNHKKIIDNEKSTNHKKIIDNEKSTNSEKIIDHEKSTNHKKIIDNEKSTSSEKIIDHEKSTNHKKIIDNEKSTNHKKIIDNEKSTSSEKIIDHEKFDNLSKLNNNIDFNFLNKISNAYDEISDKKLINNNINSDMLYKKQALLQKIKLSKKDGGMYFDNYNLNSDYETMKKNYQIQLNIKNKKHMVENFKNGILVVINILNTANNIYDPFGVDISDFSNNLTNNSELPEVIEQLYEKYMGDAFISPESRLLIILIMSFITGFKIRQKN